MSATGTLPFGVSKKKSESRTIMRNSSSRQGGAQYNNGGQRLIQLSASTLSLFKECPRCFWLQLKMGIHRPQTIFPSLPGGMDSVIKIYFDQFRGTKIGLPPELRGKVDGKLLDDQALLNEWRVRTGGLRYFHKELNTKLMGLLDDCLVDQGAYMPLDYKTRGWAPKEDTSNFYEHQVDIYEWLLKENGYETKGLAYLVYYHPIEVREGGLVQFEITTKKMQTDVHRARKLFEEAAMLLTTAKAPKAHSACTFCSWGAHQEEYT